MHLNVVINAPRRQVNYFLAWNEEVDVRIIQTTTIFTHRTLMQASERELRECEFKLLPQFDQLFDKYELAHSNCEWLATLKPT